MGDAPRLVVGLLDGCRGPMLHAVAALGAPAMLSMGGMFRAGELRAPPIGPWLVPSMLDSAGFVAMRMGGYRWTVAQYVEWVATNGGRGDLPFPWLHWSTMDYCCEPEIAADSSEVSRRVNMTADTLGDVLDEVDWWRDEGAADLTDPMPILQGWAPSDYRRSAELTGRVLASRGRDWPDLVGVGSVCRRSVRGKSGVLAVVEALADCLPPHVRLHLFGVKSGAVEALLAECPRIVASTDSMAYDFGARVEARQAGVSCTRALRAEKLTEWATSQMDAAARASAPPAQLRLV